LNKIGLIASSRTRYIAAPQLSMTTYQPKSNHYQKKLTLVLLPEQE